MEMNRQTGRSTRIVNFAVEQLLSVGAVIVTDHTMFEFTTLPNKVLNDFIDRVKKRFYLESRGTKKLSSKIQKIDDVKVIYFKVK